MRRVLIPAVLAPPSPPRGLPVRVLRGETMGTAWAVRCTTANDTARLRADIETRLERVTAQMSGWRADSALCRFNRLPPSTWQALPAEFAAVMRCALATAAASGGAFDPTIAPLVDLWGFGPVPAMTEGPPPDAAIAAARARVDWRRLGFDPASGRLLQPGGVRLDLSGIAKGHAVDLVAEGLEAAGIASYLVEIGGELRGRGVKPDGTPWWVAVEPAPDLVVALHGIAIATSGDDRRCFRYDGRTYGHTLDPRTGWPVDAGVVSVTVLHASCMQADALATAIAVLGPQPGPAFAARHGVAALVLARRPDGGGLVEHVSPAFAAMLA